MNLRIEDDNASRPAGVPSSSESLKTALPVMAKVQFRAEEANFLRRLDATTGECASWQTYFRKCRVHTKSEQLAHRRIL